MKQLFGSIVLAVLFLGMPAGVALAGKPQLDNGNVISQTAPYDNPQVISNIYEKKSVYGKIDSTSSVDIYKFTPDKDGEQTFALVTRGSKGAGAPQPLLILLDKTTATQEQALQLPLPATDYHTAIITSVEGNRTYLEPALFQHFTFYAEQKLTLKKNTDYYLVVIEPYGQAVNYAIKVGDGTTWTFADVIKNFPDWVRVQTNSYAGSSPFTFSAKISAFLLFLVGLLALAGTFIIEHIFSFSANRSKAAGYLLVKMQRFARIITWVSLWFVAIGGYMYFTSQEWAGIPFVLMVIFIVLLISLLVYTFRLSPQIGQLEVTKQEATVPLPLRKKVYVSFIVSFLSLASFVTLLSIYLVK